MCLVLAVRGCVFGWLCMFCIDPPPAAPQSLVCVHGEFGLSRFKGCVLVERAGFVCMVCVNLFMLGYAVVFP